MILYGVHSRNTQPERGGGPVLDGVLVLSKEIADKFAANGCPVTVEDTDAPGYMNPPSVDDFADELAWAERMGYVL